jgi:hypothetical protein
MLCGVARCGVHLHTCNITQTLVHDEHSAFPLCNAALFSCRPGGRIKKPNAGPFSSRAAHRLAHDRRQHVFVRQTAATRAALGRALHHRDILLHAQDSGFVHPRLNSAHSFLQATRRRAPMCALPSEENRLLRESPARSGPRRTGARRRGRQRSAGSGEPAESSDTREPLAAQAITLKTSSRSRATARAVSPNWVGSGTACCVQAASSSSKSLRGRSRQREELVRTRTGSTRAALCPSDRDRRSAFPATPPGCPRRTEGWLRRANQHRSTARSARVCASDRPRTLERQKLVLDAVDGRRPVFARVGALRPAQVLHCCSHARQLRLHVPLVEAAPRALVSTQEHRAEWRPAQSHPRVPSTIMSDGNRRVSSTNAPPCVAATARRRVIPRLYSLLRPRRRS